MKTITQKHAGTGVTLRTEDPAAEINPRTALERVERDEVWVEVTRHLRGTEVEMGGASACNLHLSPSEGGSLVKIACTPDQMRGNDWLYETVLVQVTARQHFVTKEETDHKFVKLVGPPGKIPFAERIKRLTEANKGRWAGVTDAAAYVRGLRDDDEDAACDKPVDKACFDKHGQREFHCDGMPDTPPHPAKGKKRTSRA